MRAPNMVHLYFTQWFFFISSAYNPKIFIHNDIFMRWDPKSTFMNFLWNMLDLKSLPLNEWKQFKEKSGREREKKVEKQRLNWKTEQNILLVLIHLSAAWMYALLCCLNGLKINVQITKLNIIAWKIVINSNGNRNSGLNNN